MNADTQARLIKIIRYMRRDLRQTESWHKSPILHRRPAVSKYYPRRMPMNAMKLEEYRCRFVVLIMREAQNLN